MLSLVELFTEIGAVFKLAQDLLKIKGRRLPVALGMYFLVDNLGIY